MRRVSSRVAATVVLLVLGGCGDDPFLVRWTENPRETTLFALDREEMNRPAGFNMLARSRVVIEDPLSQGNWDFSVERRGGRMLLVPPSVLGVQSRAALVPMEGTTFDDVRRAPRDTLLYITDDPVPAEFGTVYVVRTHEQLGRFNRVCVYYGKFEPVEIDIARGTFRFRHDTSPDCNNRSLVPPN